MIAGNLRLRSVFLAGCIVLALPGLVATGFQAIQAESAWQKSRQVAQETQVAAEAMNIATRLMIERGRWQEAAARDSVDSAMLRQSMAETDEALDRTERAAQSAGSSAAAVRQTREALGTVRARAETVVLKKTSLRAPMEQYNRLVETLEAEIARLERDITLVNPQVGIVLSLAETASTLRSIAGRRGVLLNSWFAGQDLAPGQKDELTVLSGRLTGTWEGLRRGIRAAGLPAKPTEDTVAAAEEFFAAKEPWYRELVKAAIAGAERPLQFEPYRVWHVTALEQLLPVRQILMAEARIKAETTIDAARWRLATFLGIGMLSLGLVVGAVLALLRGLVEPVRGMTNAMASLAGGNLTIVPPKHSRLREIGAMGAAVGVFRDALEGLHRQKTELAKANLRFETALSSMVQGLCQYDAEDRLEVFNHRFSEIFRIQAGRMQPGLSFAHVVRLTFEAGNYPGHSVEEVIAERTAWSRRPQAGTLVLDLADGRLVSVSSSPLANGGWIATYEDVTERRRSEQQLWHMARHDALTNLPNRVLLREHLEAVVPRLRRGDSVAVLYLDLDGFKAINDTMGYAVGDALLRAVADRLRATTRETDLVARLGGDEFAVVQSDADQPVSAAALAERLVTIMATPFDLQGQSVEIGTSIGVVLADSDPDPDELLRSADIALYQAKAGGRGTWRFFEPSMDAEMQARRALEVDLRRALKENQFEMNYQPLIVARSGALSGFEALIRWRHPERGMVSPAAFIPLAEETGLIRSIGAWVLLTACEAAASWPESIKVAVNLSPVQFIKGELVQDVEHALAVSGLAAERLELEITESVLLQDNDATLALLHRLRALGVSISMDDFGTGYSSLSYLRSFPFNKIKIDQSFVRNLQQEKGGVEIVRAVVDLGKGLGMTVLAEGVETEEQRAILTAERCDELQGYLFSKPRPIEDVPAIIASYPSAAQDVTQGVRAPQPATGVPAAAA